MADLFTSTVILHYWTASEAAVHICIQKQTEKFSSLQLFSILLYFCDQTVDITSVLHNKGVMKDFIKSEYKTAAPLTL